MKTSSPDWDWETHTIRRETGLVEHVCEHGIGHPNPGSVVWLQTYGPEGSLNSWGIHGCDGCCQDDNFPSIRDSLTHARKLRSDRAETFGEDHGLVQQMDQHIADLSVLIAIDRLPEV